MERVRAWGVGAGGTLDPGSLAGNGLLGILLGIFGKLWEQHGWTAAWEPSEVLGDVLGTLRGN